MLDFMDWGAYPKQYDMRKKVLDRLLFKIGNKKIYVVFGGNRSGKTELGAGVVCEAMEEKPGLKAMCCTVDYKLSIKVQQTKINKLMRKSKIKYGRFNKVKGYTNETIILKNEAMAYFRTYQQGREAIQGDDLDFIWGDEEMPWDYFQECLARLTDRDGIFLLTFTSLSGFTRLVNMLWESNNSLVESCILSLLDNPFIPQQAKDDYLATCDPDEKESRVEGKPHLKEGLIYKEFGQIHKIESFDHVQYALANPKRYELHEGIDPHERTPHHWIRFLYDRQENIIYICDELKAPYESMVVQDFSRLIKLKRGQTNIGHKLGPNVMKVNNQVVSTRAYIKPRFCQIDTSSQKPDVITKHPDEDQENVHTVRLEFHKCGIETMLCTKDNAVGIGEVKKRLKTVRTREGVVKRRPMIYVCKSCIGVIWEFSRYSWASYSSAKIAEKNEVLNAPQKKDDHYMDIIKYEVIKVRNDHGSVEPTLEYQEQYEGMGY